MHLNHLLSLPPAIIALCASSSVVAAQADSHQQQWPHNVPKHLKYFPEDEVHARRGLSVAQRLQHEKPIGVKKMSLDESEMFMLDNWIFASDSQQPSRRSDSDSLGNLTVQAVSPLRPLAQSDWLARMHIRDVLLKRQFQCPEGTNSCESIGAPDVCCGTGSDCINTSGSSDAGKVGCCPKGQTCAGNVSCDSASGYSSCPGSPNGGCCMPGFKCLGVGCIREATSTAFIPPSSTSTTAAPPAPTSTAGQTPTTPSPSSTTPPPTSSSSSSSTAYTCSTGWFSCPASLGGGCCQTGRTCATGASCIGDPPTTSTRAPDAPIRPTSGTTTAAQATSADVCPQGFYVCSAYYPSGCCRVGRDCQTTGSSCMLPTGTVVDTNGVTVVAPTTSARTCPSAWYSCAAAAGGNCCPQGYACGDEQCTATASGQAGTTAKATPSSSSSPASSVAARSTAVSMVLAAAIAVTVGLS